MVVVALATNGCYSMAVARVPVVATCSTETRHLHVWISDQGFLEGAPVVSRVLAATLLYPVNLVFGCVLGVRAPFDADYDIRMGPVGFVVGTLVPGFTLLPHVYPIRPWELTLGDEDYRQLMQGIAAGEGAAAFRRLLMVPPWSGGVAAVLDAAFDESPAAEPQSK